MLYLHQKRRKHRARVPNASGTRSIIRDYAGQRFEKKVTTKGDITTHHRYLYRGYLQIAAVNLKANAPTPDQIDIMVSEIRCATGIRVRIDLYKN